VLHGEVRSSRPMRVDIDLTIQPAMPGAPLDPFVGNTMMPGQNLEQKVEQR
jgi:hypothetical protein